MTDVSIMRDTLEITLAKDDTFPQRFYDHLFTAHPEVRPLFHRSSQGALNKMFAQKLISIVDHLNDPDWLARELTRLATNHKGYGVSIEMYPWVGEALIATLREACGDAWSATAERAWLEGYASLVRAIVAATP